MMYVFMFPLFGLSTYSPTHIFDKDHGVLCSSVLPHEHTYLHADPPLSSWAYICSTILKLPPEHHLHYWIIAIPETKAKHRNNLHWYFQVELTIAFSVRYFEILNEGVVDDRGYAMAGNSFKATCKGGYLPSPHSTTDTGTPQKTPTTDKKVDWSIEDQIPGAPEEEMVMDLSASIVSPHAPSTAPS